MTAYAAWKREDLELAQRALDNFIGAAAGLRVIEKPYLLRIVEPSMTLESVKGVSLWTNAVSQFGLTAIQILALLGESASETVPEREWR